MKEITNKNNTLKLCVDDVHAEPVALFNSHGENLLWKGDAQYWDKHDPILFPTVGKSYEGYIRVQGKVYDMPKHGFAQGGPWQVVEHGVTDEGDGLLILEFRDSDSTRQHYPFSFVVRQCFELTDNALRVTWQVSSDTDLPFMMGAHPAFALPDFDPADEVHGYLQFDMPDIKSQIVLPDGYLHPEYEMVQLLDGNLLPLGNHTFECDTLLDIRGINREVTLLDKHRNPILTLSHSMPVIALWAPQSGCCPFVCIEPWSGGCDAPDYVGEFSERPFMQHIKGGETWTTSYEVLINNCES